MERLAQLLDYMDAELLGNCNFEFLQVGLLSDPAVPSVDLLHLILSLAWCNSRTWLSMHHGCCPEGRYLHKFGDDVICNACAGIPAGSAANPR